MEETMKEKIYEVDIVREDGVRRGAAIISDKGITLKDDDGDIVICFDTVNIKRDGYDWNTYNAENKSMSREQLQDYWDVTIDVVSKMIKRGIFSVNSFNCVVNKKVREILISNNVKKIKKGKHQYIHESACPHYER